MHFQLIVCPLLVLFQQLFAIPPFRCPMKAVWSFASPHLPVAVAGDIGDIARQPRARRDAIASICR